MKSKVKIKVGIVGCGAIGSGIAAYIDKNLNKKLKIVALADLDSKMAAQLKGKLRSRVVCTDVEDLIKKSDLVVEAASGAAVKGILEKIIVYKKDVFILSAGGLINNFSLLRRAQKERLNIYVPSGAICGVDAIGALSLGNIRKITLTTSKPPIGLTGANYLKIKKINLKDLKKEKIIFKGSVAKAVKYFPKNINVAAILVLASRSRNVEVCIKANPNLKRNTHCIQIDAKEAKISMLVENVPSKLNPKTSSLAILSAQYFFHKLCSSLKVGS